VPGRQEHEWDNYPKKKRRRTLRRPELTVAGILARAEEHRQRMIQGIRGFPGGDTLARFLARHRGAPHPADIPRLTVEQILTWADAH
jgi:hypothetical protein